MPRFDTIDELLDTLYSVISGAAGEPRDWDLERQLFHATSRATRTGVDESNRPWAKVMTTEEFVADAEPFLAANDFHEIEIAREVQRFGNLASVRSVYEARRHPDDPELLKRGINFLHLFNDGERWWVMNIIWDNEREGVTVPEAWKASP